MDTDTIMWLHNRIANTIWLYMLILGGLNLVNYVRGRGLEGNVLGALILGEGLVITQALLGVILILLGLYPLVGIIHILYGVVSVLVIPAIWVYTHGAADRRAAMIWALVCFFLFGLALRGIGTSPAG
jgi:hypothetical protein